MTAAAVLLSVERTRALPLVVVVRALMQLHVATLFAVSHAAQPTVVGLVS